MTRKEANQFIDRLEKAYQIQNELENPGVHWTAGFAGAASHLLTMILSGQQDMAIEIMRDKIEKHNIDTVPVLPQTDLAKTIHK